MMDHRVRSKLPLVFAKGHPARLQDLPLVQLQKFVPFMVKCVTKADLETSHSSEDSHPPWWPSEFPFFKDALTEKIPQREMRQRLLQIVTSCYSYHKSSYILSISTSLAAGHQFYGKLSFRELPNGTTKILNSKKQLIVVIRTSTRHYDANVNGFKNSRRSARLEDTCLNIPATDFKNCFKVYTQLTRLEDLDSNKASSNMKGVKRKVVDDITNQVRSEKSYQAPQNKPRPKSSYIKKSKSRKRGRGKNQIEDLSTEVSCKFCKEVFDETHLAQEHEDICQKTVSKGNDLRDYPDRVNGFAASLGLVPTLINPPEVIKPERSPKRKASLPPPAPMRNLRKVPARSKIGIFIKSHPMPITSLRGQSILQQYGERVKPSLTSSAPLYEKDCRSRRTTVPHLSPKITTMKKHKTKDNQYTHTYTFGKAKKRLVRHTELVLGISSKSFALFNKCKPLSVKITKVPEKVVQEINLRDKEKRRQRELRLARIVRESNVYVKLHDFKLDLDVIPLAFRKSAKNVLKGR